MSILRSFGFCSNGNALHPLNDLACDLANLKDRFAVGFARKFERNPPIAVIDERHGRDAFSAMTLQREQRSIMPCAPIDVPIGAMAHLDRLLPYRRGSG